MKGNDYEKNMEKPSLSADSGSGHRYYIRTGIVSLRYILSQVINFCVPLIIIGFIAPSITKLGSSASRMLGVALVCAYASSVLAALFSMGAGYGLIPHLSIASQAGDLKELPEMVFQLDIPPVMEVMSALVLSVLIGLAAAWTKAKNTIRLLEEFQKMILLIVTKVVIPILPFFIAATFCTLSYEGTITKQLPVFIHNRVDRPLYLAGPLIRSCRYLLQDQSSEGIEKLRPGLYNGHRNHVFCGYHGSGSEMCKEV